MTVGEARNTYGYQLMNYNVEKSKLSKKRAELEDRIKITPNGKQIFENEAAILELSYDAVSKKQEEYKSYMSLLMEQWNSKYNEVALRENAEAEKEGMQELGKIMEVARRMMHGDSVPPGDEKKLMEYDNDLYQMAKNAQTMERMNKKKHKEYESLWEDEEKRERENPMETADSQEALSSGPELVSVEDTIAEAISEAGIVEG